MQWKFCIFAIAMILWQNLKQSWLVLCIRQCIPRNGFNHKTVTKLYTSLLVWAFKFKALSLLSLQLNIVDISLILGNPVWENALILSLKLFGILGFSGITWDSLGDCKHDSEKFRASSISDVNVVPRFFAFIWIM